MPVTLKTEELKLYKFLHDELLIKSHISLDDIFVKIRSQSNLFLKYFQCVKCIEASLEKFPDCFYISKRGNVLMTDSVDISQPSGYLNYAVIGSAVTEILTIFTTLLAKLQLYKCLVNTLYEKRAVGIPLNLLLNDASSISDACKKVFRCKHVLIKTIEEFSDIFEIVWNKYSSETIIRQHYTLDCGREELGKVFNSDRLLELLDYTLVQTSAETQLYATLQTTLQSSFVPVSTMHRNIKKSSQACNEYFSTAKKLETVLSMSPDLCYINKLNHVELHKNTKQVEEWYSGERINLDIYDNLVLHLNKMLCKELEIIKLVKTAKQFLKKYQFASQTDLHNFIKLNFYCKHFQTESVCINTLLKFSKIFHKSKNKNIFLLKNVWSDKSIRNSHRTESESLLDIGLNICIKILSEIYLYCYLIWHFRCYNTSILLRQLIASLPDFCRNVTSEEKIKENILNFPDIFYIDNKDFIHFKLNSENNTLNKISELKCHKSTSTDDLPFDESSKYNNLAAGILTTQLSKEKKKGNINENQKEPIKLNNNQTYNTVNSAINHSKAESVEWGTNNILRCSGIVCPISETEGFIRLDGKDLTILTIIDVIYNNGKQVTNLFLICEQKVNCIAIEDRSCTEDNWKAVLVWIGAAPTNVPCAVKSKKSWKKIKRLYEKRYKEFNAEISFPMKTCECEIVTLEQQIQENQYNNDYQTSKLSSNQNLNSKTNLECCRTETIHLFYDRKFTDF